MKKRIALELGLFLLAALPGLLYSYLSIQEPWTLFRLARILQSIQQNVLVNYTTTASAYRIEHLGGEFLDSVMILASSWSAEWLGLAPIGSILFVLFYYAFAYRLSGSRLVAALIAVYVGWYYPRLISQYSIQTYVWTNLLFIGFLMVFYVWIRHRKPGYSLLIILLFIVTFLFYQTTPIWIIIAVGTASLLLFLKRRGSMGRTAKVSWALAVFCIVIYLSFDTVLYNNFLLRATSEVTNQELLQSITSKVLAPLFQESPKILKPFEVAIINPVITTQSTLFSLLIMVTPVIFWVIVKIVRSVKSRDHLTLIKHPDDIFIWSMIVVALVHAVGYMAYGAISTRVIPLVFPFLLILIPKNLELRWPSLPAVGAGLLAFVSVVGLISYSTIMRPDSKPSDIGQAYTLIPDRARLIADAGVFGAFQVKGAMENRIFDLSWLDSSLYGNVLTLSDPNALDGDFLIVDKYNKPITTSGWIYLEPWRNNIPLIESNPVYSKIYDSRYISIFQSAQNPLPVIERAGNPSPPSSSPEWLSAQMVFMWVFFLILPGALFLFLIIEYSYVELEGPYIFTSLSIVISICFIVILGYLANFSGIGLDNTPWVIAVVSIAMVGFIVHRRQIILAQIRKKRSELITLACIVLVWSILMTGVAYVRTDQTSNNLEAFLTQESESSIVQMNIVSSMKEITLLRVYYSIDGMGFSTDEFPIYPNQTISYAIQYPVDAQGKRITIIVTADRIGENLSLSYLQP